MMNNDQILPNVFVGSCPRRPADADHLKQELGVTAVLSLQTAEDFVAWGIDWQRLVARYAELDIELRHVPVLDFDAEDLRRNLPQCAAALDELLRKGHTAYVHCSAGVNRSPSTVIAYLHWMQKWDLDKALDHVTRRRSCDPYVHAIRLAAEDREGL